MGDFDMGNNMQARVEENPAHRKGRQAFSPVGEKR